jgi:hypothetical protein
MVVAAAMAVVIAMTGAQIGAQIGASGGAAASWPLADGYTLPGAGRWRTSARLPPRGRVAARGARAAADRSG